MFGKSGTTGSIGFLVGAQNMYCDVRYIKGICLKGTGAGEDITFTDDDASSVTFNLNGSFIHIW